MTPVQLFLESLKQVREKILVDGIEKKEVGGGEVGNVCWNKICLRN